MEDNLNTENVTEENVINEAAVEENVIKESISGEAAEEAATSEVVSDENAETDDDFTDSIQIADDVVSSIIGLAVTEVDGVSKLTGDITRDIVAMLGKKNLSKGIKVEKSDELLKVSVSVEIKFGYNIMAVSKEIQEKVRQSLLTMTGLECSEVNVRVSGIDFTEDAK